jgi:hypothetical protein
VAALLTYVAIKAAQRAMTEPANAAESVARAGGAGGTELDADTSRD